MSLLRVAWFMWLLGTAGCASAAELAPSSGGPAPVRQAVPTLNGSYHRVQRGETLWRIARAYGLHPESLAAANRMRSNAAIHVGQRLFIPLPQESGRFLWPARGSLGTGGPSKGIRIRVPSGSLVRASRGGRVAVATSHLSGWGKTIIVDHLDGYLTVYAGLNQLLVPPGLMIRQGMPIGNMGAGALYFEIRQGAKAHNVLSLLPSE